MKLKILDRVKLTEQFKTRLLNQPKPSDHIKEFGELEGVVIGYPHDNEIDVLVIWENGEEFKYNTNSLELIEVVKVDDIHTILNDTETYEENVNGFNTWLKLIKRS